MGVQVTHRSASDDESNIKEIKAKSPKKTRGRKVAGVGDLPIELRDTYTKLVTPRYVELIGNSMDPWFSPECRVMQSLFNSSYDDIDCVIERDTAPYDVVILVSCTD